jgi:hypothetical protein
MTGFLYCDWFAGDRYGGEDPALGVGLVNFLLKATGIDLQLSIAKDPDSAEADLLSDWFAGWANSSKSGTLDQNLAQRFDALTQRQSPKVDWIRYRCVLNVIDSESVDRADENRSAE